MELPDQFVLRSPLGNGFADEDDPKALEFVEIYNHILDRIKAKDLYIEYVSGNLKGSIARIEPGKISNQETEIWRRRNMSWNSDKPFYISRTQFYFQTRFAGRKNCRQENSSNKDIVFLPNYKGPTVYQVFDVEKAKQDYIKNAQFYDIEGRELNIGDLVLYINIRYGYATELCRGFVKEVRVSNVVQGTKPNLTLVIEGKNQVLSELKYPDSMVYKLEES